MSLQQSARGRNSVIGTALKGLRVAPSGKAAWLVEEQAQEVSSPLLPPFSDWDLVPGNEDPRASRID